MPTAKTPTSRKIINADPRPTVGTTPRLCFPWKKKDWKLVKNILSNYRSDFIKTQHTVFIAQKLLKNANKWKNYQCRSKAYIGDYAKALLSLKNKVIIHEYGRYNVASTMWEVGLWAALKNAVQMCSLKSWGSKLYLLLPFHSKNLTNLAILHDKWGLLRIQSDNDCNHGRYIAK